MHFDIKLHFAHHKKFLCIKVIAMIECTSSIKCTSISEHWNGSFDNFCQMIGISKFRKRRNGTKNVGKHLFYFILVESQRIFNESSQKGFEFKVISYELYQSIHNGSHLRPRWIALNPILLYYGYSLLRLPPVSSFHTNSLFLPHQVSPFRFLLSVVRSTHLKMKVKNEIILYLNKDHFIHK